MRVEPLDREQPRGTWGEAPWTVQAFAYVNAAGLIVWLGLNGFEAWPRAVFSAALSIAITYGLVRGYRGAWAIGMFFAVLGVLGTFGFVSSWINGAPIEPEEMTSIVVWLVTSAILLHPLTRRWTARS